MNIFKKTLAMFLVLCLLFGAAPVTAFADEANSTNPTITETSGETKVPETTVSETSVPETSVPETSVPETSVPETSVPETSVPETSVPETSVPETSVPETTVPETSVPETTVPETSVPETSVPETSVPETTVPETSVPETSVPETSVPETSVPETSVPETSVPETTVPQMSIPQVNMPLTSPNPYGTVTTDLDADLTATSSTLSNKPADGTSSAQPFPLSIMGTGHYRIPAFVTTKNGTLVAAADARWHVWDSTDDNGDIDTIVSRSSDNGTTWNYTFANYIDNGNTTDYGAATFIDPALAYDGNTIYMIVDLYPGQSGQNNCTSSSKAGTGYDGNGNLLLSTNPTADFNDTNFTYYLSGGRILSRNGNTDQGYTVDARFNVKDSSGNSCGNLFDYDNTCGFHPLMTSHLYLTKSTDDGATWSDPVMLNHQIKNAAETYFLVSPGRGVVASDGTIIFGVYAKVGDTEQASIIYSNDSGVTWHRSGNSGFTSSEDEIVELSNGTLRMFYRYGHSYSGTVRYVDITKNSNGSYSWGSPVSTSAPFNGNVNISAISYSKTTGGKQVILVSCPADTSGTWNRYDGKIYTFTFDGTDMELVSTYDVDSSSSKDAFSYSCLTEQADGSIGMLYEKGDSGNITYINLNAETVTGLTFDDEPNDSLTPSTPSNPETSTEVTVSDKDISVQDATEVTEIAGLTDFVAYNVTLAKDGADYKNAATITIPLNGKFGANVVLWGFVLEDNGTVTYVKNAVRDTTKDTLTFTAPHFSTVGAAPAKVADVTITSTVDVHIPVGNTSQTYTHTDGNYADSATIEDNTVASMNVTGVPGTTETTVSTTKATQLEDGATYIIRYVSTWYALTSNQGGTTWDDSDGTTLAFEFYNRAETDNMWTLEASGNGYKIKCAAGYLNLGKNAAWLDDSGEVFTFTYNNNGWAIGDGTYNIDALGGLTSYRCAGGWPNSSTRFELYKVTTAASASTEVSFTGLKVGTTTAVVGTTQYNITVEPEQRDITLQVGQTQTDTINNAGYTIDHVTTWPTGTIVTLDSVIPTGATLVPVTTIESGKHYLIVNRKTEDVLTNTAVSVTGQWDPKSGLDTTGKAASNSTELWEITASGNGYTIVQDGQYLTTAGYYAAMSDTKTVLALSYTDSGWTIMDNTTWMSLDGHDQADYYLCDYVGHDYRDAALATSIINEHCYWDIYEIDAATGSTEVSFTGQKAGTTTVVVGNVQYNIHVESEPRNITINYQANGTTVATDTLSVEADVTTVTLPDHVTDSNSNIYVVDNTTLTLTDATSYNVNVSALKTVYVTTENTPFTGNTGTEGVNKNISNLIIGTGTAYDLDLNVEGDIVWGTTSDKITVNQNGLVTGVTATDADETVYVTATVNGVVYHLPVAVLAVETSGQTRTIDFYSQEVLNCTAYYSYQGNDLVEFPEGSMFYVVHSMPDTDIASFFATPNPGYAVTYANGTGGTYFHIVRDEAGTGFGFDANDDGSCNHTLPMKDGNDKKGYDYAHDQLVAYVARNSGALTYDQIHAMLNNAVTNGCDAMFFFSRGSGTGSMNSSTTFIAEKLPTLSKTIDGVLPATRQQSNYRRYTEGLVANVAELVYFKIAVTLDRPLTWVKDANGNDTNVGAIQYSNAWVEDTVLSKLNQDGSFLEGAYLYTKELDQADGTWDGEIAFANRVTKDDITAKLNAPWADTENQRVVELYLMYQIQTDDIAKHTIDNTAHMSYSYTSQYSRGSTNAEADAAASITVVGNPMDNIVIDFGQPVVYTGLTESRLKYAHTGTFNTTYGTVTVEGVGEKHEDNHGEYYSEYKVTYTPTAILQEPDTVQLMGEYKDLQGNLIKKVINAFTVYPATTIYYEEGFIFGANATSNWDYYQGDKKVDSPAKATTNQVFELLGKSNYTDDGKLTGFTSEKQHPYGYDPMYLSKKGTSALNSYATSTAIGAKTSFTFTGTGIQIFVNAAEDTGYACVEVKGSAGNVVNVSMVNTVVKAGETDATTGQTGNQDGLPIVSLVDLQNMPHDTYTVNITKVMNRKPIYIEGIRVFNTVKDSSFFTIDKEDYPRFYELRDYVLNALTIGDSTSQQYGNLQALASQIYNGVCTHATLVLNMAYDSTVVPQDDGSLTVAVNYGTELGKKTYILSADQFSALTKTSVRLEMASSLEGKPFFLELNPDGSMSTGWTNDSNSVKEGTWNIADSDAPTAVITSADDIYGNSASAQDLLDNGPKNELFLYPGQSLTFNVTTKRVMQIGLKAPRGETTAKITGAGNTRTQAVQSSVDMFYDLVGAAQTATEYTISITNTGSDILSVTLLKVCDDPSFAFNALTAADIKDVLMDVYNLKDAEIPAEPEVPAETTKPAEPEVPAETTKPAEPEVPAETTKPAEPEVPAETTKPAEPEVPAETTKPAEPEVPAETTKPAEPEVPAETTKPAEPEVPAETTKPAEPEVPAETTKPAEPEVPAETTKPAEPEVPAETTKPAEPEVPAETTKPAEPEVPAETTKPAEPEVPAETTKPAEPEVPAETTKPAEPEVPAETTKPAEPEVPAETTKPAEPEVPAETTKPAEPEVPAETTKPAEPEVPAETTKPTESELPEEPEVPAESETPAKKQAKATFTVKIVGYSDKVLGDVKLTAKGAKGDTHVFTAAEIIAAVKNRIPDSYTIVDETIANAKVVYGESGQITVQIGKVAKLKITFVNLLGQKQSCETVTMVQTSAGSWRVSAASIRAMAPENRIAFRLFPAIVPFGNTTSIVVPIF